MNIADRLWRWPNGLVWRITHKKTVASRQKRFDLFMNVIRPKADDKVLDVGAGEGKGRAVNFFEDWYPYQKQLTVLSVEAMPEFKKRYPKIKLVVGDGRALPFADNSFDIYFSNAVLEHVGSFENQKRFVHEACRVAKKVFIATPYRWFPVDFHTVIPFAHYFPMPMRNIIYKIFGRKFYASEESLRLTDIHEIKRMLPSGVKMKIYKQRLLGLVSNINIILERR